MVAETSLQGFLPDTFMKMNWLWDTGPRRRLRPRSLRQTTLPPCCLPPVNSLQLRSEHHTLHLKNPQWLPTASRVKVQLPTWTHTPVNAKAAFMTPSPLLPSVCCWVTAPVSQMCQGTFMPLCFLTSQSGSVWQRRMGCADLSRCSLAGCSSVEQ